MITQFECLCKAEITVTENRLIVYCWNCGRGWSFRRSAGTILNVSDATVIGFRNIRPDDDTFNKRGT